MGIAVTRAGLAALAIGGVLLALEPAGTTLANIHTARPAVPARRVKADFNGDGYADLAIGAGYEPVLGQSEAGTVDVLYGSPSGLTVAGNQMWTQNSPGLPGGPATALAHFGFALAVADFDADGYADLAIGIARDRFTPQPAAVLLLYGGPGGLSAARAQYFDETTPGMVGGGAQAGDRFGYSLYSCDFNGDGYADLAIGAPYRQENGQTYAGGVHVLYGGPGGLSVSGNQEWSASSPGVAGVGAKANALFGRALAAGDFDHDGYCDLAIGAPEQIIDQLTGAGSVTILKGSAGGLTASGSQFWNGDSLGMPGGGAGIADAFGIGLSSGDYNGDGYADLAIGVPLKDVNGISNTGGVNILYGSARGLSTTGAQFWSLATSGLKGGASQNDYMGSALASADFDQNGYDDLAIGDAEKTVNGVKIAGAVTVLLGSRNGLGWAGNELFTANSYGIGIGAQTGAKFGYAVFGADFNGDGYPDLAIGIRGQNVDGKSEAGAIEILRGQPIFGLGTAGSQYFTQDTPGMVDHAHQNDRFGRALPFS